MKLFLSTIKQDDYKTHLMRQLNDLGVIIFANAFNSQNNDSISFEKLDGLIIEGGELNQQAGYLCALAISQKKPILYLLPKGSLIPEEISIIKNNRDVNKFLIIKFYENGDSFQRILEFIDLIERGDRQWDMPSIKFTWRITPRIDRYLRWKTVNTGKNKADWLRDFIIKELIDKDDNYSKFLNND